MLFRGGRGRPRVSSSTATRVTFTLGDIAPEVCGFMLTVARRWMTISVANMSIH